MPKMEFPGDTVWEFHVAPCVKKPYRTLQRLKIYVNDFLVISCEVDRSVLVKFTLPKEVLNRVGENWVRLWHPDSLQPSTIMKSNDARDISIWLKSIVVRTACKSESLHNSSDEHSFHWEGKTEGHPSAHLGRGWAREDTPRGVRLWMVGDDSEVCLPPLSKKLTGKLSMDISPFILLPYRTVQRLSIEINGHRVDQLDLSTKRNVTILFPSALLSETEQNLVRFHHPDYIIPDDVVGNSDRREVATFLENLYIDFSRETRHDEAEADISLRDLMLRFESLGQNCEFGLVQRRAGADPLGLFRWSSTAISSILRGIKSEFKDIGAADSIVVETAPSREFMVREKTYGLFYHTWIFEGQANAEEIRARETKKLLFLARKFMTDLEDGEKVLLYKHDPRLNDAQLMELKDGIRNVSNNPILVVSIANNEPPGLVVDVGDNVYLAYMDRFAPSQNAYDFSFNCWVQICLQTVAMIEARKSGCVVPE
ncbi:hypothetical protein FBZ89_12110 [Nitrospirillum amazonense]|uniref:Uncharacterized protein n=2 Tax=Nitrospirillum amazonense TaxID=28077 RepID=A0A560EUI0_9PROT|nr:hypothetical protein FBZ89_12110 [Nitrospirillum amazonense]